MHPGIPVIVVGNLSVGGSGKTPLVLWIAEFLKAHDWSPAIVSRGYGGAGGAPRAATIASEPDEVGDEPVLLARRSGCPVWIGAERSKVIEALRAQHPETDVVVLDDGLQHYRLRRDLEIAVVGFARLRQRVAAARRTVARAAAAVAHRRRRCISIRPPASERGTRILSRCGWKANVAHRMSDARERQPLHAWRGRAVHAVAGIGNPSRFFVHAGQARPEGGRRIRSRTITPLPPASSSSATSRPC